MNLGHYRLLAQLGAGKDGIAYRAQVPGDETPIEVRVLTCARNDVERWNWLARRFRLAAMLEHPAAVHLRELNLVEDPPFVALEWVRDHSLASDLHAGLPLPESEVVSLGGTLVSVLQEAHRLGLVHGRLGPRQVHRVQGQPKLDFTGLDVQSALEPLPFADLDAACVAPEASSGATLDSAADVYSLGALLYWLLAGRLPARGQIIAPLKERAEPLELLLREMLADEPSNRPLLSEVEARLSLLRQPITSGAPSAALDEGISVGVTVVAPPALKEESPREQHGRARLLQELGQRDQAASEALVPGDQLGRFRLLAKLGQGGMGVVYRAEDVADGTVVAIKVLPGAQASRPEARRRFHKEARLLAEANNPYVTNLLEINEDNGLLYLVLEFVAGRNLAQLLAERGRLEEPLALSIVADVARALVTAHERGIVHRDVKPENILLVSEEGARGEAVSSPGNASPRVKLSDFGLARHIIESESLQMTRTGAVLGTLLYMAPEQCSGEAVDQRCDVYALGATLFHLLAGRPPFVAASSLAVAAMHCNEPPPALHKLNPAVSEAVCRIVEKCLAKVPEARYSDAAALLDDLERLLRGEPADITLHPRLPACDPAKVLSFDFTWELESSPAELWPHVANTERLNRAVGLPAVEFTTRAGEDASSRVRRFGRFRKLGFTAAWEEHPFEWIEARRMGVLREYSQGPFKWLISVVELTPRAGGGTTLTHKAQVEPHGLLGRTIAAVEVGIKGRRALDRVYRRIDAALCGKLGNRTLADPFEEPAALSGARRRRLDSLLDRLSEHGIDPGVVEQLGDYLALAPAQEVSRIRPLALARRLALDPEQVVDACLHGAREGLLLLLWDILCPVCRIPSEIKDTLRGLRDHGQCDACNLDFDLDFANSVEMIFRVHPEVRASELGVYCIGGPAHSPHVAAQVRVAPGERVELGLALTEGAYRLRGPQLPFTLDFRVQPSARASRWELHLARGPHPELPRNLKAGHQVIVLTNDSSQELLVRVERTTSREDALTAARASTLALFRELFPGEILSSGQLASVANVTLLVTDLEGVEALYQELGDAQAFARVHEHFRLLDEGIRREGGALVKTVGAGVVAAFHEPVAAVRAALAFQELMAKGELTRGLRLRVGIHRGPALVATLNDHLDYFGGTVRLAMSLPQSARGGELVLTEAVSADASVAIHLRTCGLDGEVVQVEIPDGRASILLRLSLPCKLE